MHEAINRASLPNESMVVGLKAKKLGRRMPQTFSDGVRNLAPKDRASFIFGRGSIRNIGRLANPFFRSEGPDWKNEAERFILRKNIPVELADDTVRFNFMGNCRNIKLSFRLGPGSMQTIYETFFLDEYASLDPAGKIVLDLGGNIADTAIYSACLGAKHVYSLEPFPYAYEIALQNIRANGMQGSITMLDAGIGEYEDEILVDSGFQNGTGSRLDRNPPASNLHPASSGAKRVPIVTLRRLVEKYGLENAVLKVDVEGYEYGVLLNAENRVLQKFDTIMVECHLGDRNIIRKLEGAGFVVRRLRGPSYAYCYMPGSEPHRILSMLCAERTR